MTPSSDWTIKDWQEFARRDDCLDRMVPSDLRRVVGMATRGGKLAESMVDLRINADFMDVNGGDFQDALVAAGVLLEVEQEKPCTDDPSHCNCYNHDADFPTTCLVTAGWVTGVRSR